MGSKNSNSQHKPDTTELLNASLRILGESFSLPEQWANKYGASEENDVFSMHPYCWCEEDSCPYCGEERRPNFHYKPTDFKVWWYKYIGRGMETSRSLDAQECAQMLAKCLELTPTHLNPIP